MRPKVSIRFPLTISASATVLFALSLIGGNDLVEERHPTRAYAAAEYSAAVGGGGRGISVDVFLPSVIFVNEGDTVKWNNPYDEGHTVTFLAGKTAPPATDPPTGSNPTSFDGTNLINSAVLAKGQTYTVTFTKTGTFPFLCLRHTAQQGSVTVLPAGVHVPTQAQRDFEAQKLLDDGIAAGMAAAAAVPPPTRTVNEAGAATWTIPSSPAIPLPNGQADVMQFLPARLQVGVGDTIVWENETRTPHTVSFLAGGPPGSPTAIVKPSQNYDGTAYVSSGQMGTQPQFAGGTRFSLTFTKAGSYPYICILHVSQGMAGVIEVGSVAASGNVPITPPATGQAGLAGAASASGWTTSGVVLLFFAFGLSVVALRRRI